MVRRPAGSVFFAALVAWLGATACESASAPTSTLCPPGAACRTSQESEHYFQTSFNAELDLLLVIDDSASMATEREKLLRNFPQLMRAFESLAGGLPDLHVAVVSTSLGAGAAADLPGCPARGDDGAFLRGRGACTAVPRDPFINTFNDCGRHDNFDGDIEDVFSCVADLGTSGCGYEQPLAVVRRALGGDPGGAPIANRGFLRPDALLGVVIITDEDDCSVPADSDALASDDPTIGQDSPVASSRCQALADAGRLTPISDFVTFLETVKGVPGRVVVSVAARPAPRLQAFVDAFGANGSMTSLDADDLTPALARLARGGPSFPRPQCIDGALVDTDPAADGLQADCSVVDHTVAATGRQETATPLPACDVAGPPCWRMTPDARDCVVSGFAIAIDRGVCRWPADTVASVRCATCADPHDPRCPPP